MSFKGEEDASKPVTNEDCSVLFCLYLDEDISDVVVSIIIIVAGRIRNPCREKTIHRTGAPHSQYIHTNLHLPFIHVRSLKKEQL